ncbi:unnamed protein product [Moneuplotes crassus]|uniref:Uncharacterized protein n=1 Tax=Euplotes crassus TaxID=5936 RepID=A0AAD2D2V7_EUPCR|nr:unnamed protein product [Moneuplotes crassus]
MTVGLYFLFLTLFRKTVINIKSPILLRSGIHSPDIGNPYNKTLKINDSKESRKRISKHLRTNLLKFHKKIAYPLTPYQPLCFKTPKTSRYFPPLIPLKITLFQKFENPQNPKISSKQTHSLHSCNHQNPASSEEVANLTSNLSLTRKSLQHVDQLFGLRPNSKHRYRRIRCLSANQDAKLARKRYGGRRDRSATCFSKPKEREIKEEREIQQDLGNSRL